MKDDDKEKLKKQFKANQFSKDRRALALCESELKDLLHFLESELESCDHTMELTKRWIGRSGIPSEKILKSLEEFGGYCDCEVVANVTLDRFGWTE